MRSSRFILIFWSTLVLGPLSCGGGTTTSGAAPGQVSPSNEGDGGATADGGKTGATPAASQSTSGPASSALPPDAGAPPQDGASAEATSQPDPATDAAVDSQPPADAGPTPIPVGGRDGGIDAANLPSVTLYVAGDSTASVYGPASAQQGWGEHLVDFLASKVTVDDQAFPGRTVATFITSSHWTNILNGMKPGDYVMIEFGINDSSTAAGRLVPIPEFTTLLGQMVDAVLAKHATPLLVTPSALQYWTNGVETNLREQPYADAMKQVATQKSILVDDLNARSVEYLNKIGQTAAAQIYINGDKAHFTLQGAKEMASLTTQELLRIGSALGAYAK